MTPRAKELLRCLPSVSALLEHEDVREWLTGLPRPTVVASLQAALDEARADIAAGKVIEPLQVDDLLAVAEQEMFERSVPSLRRVINATGIVLHTGLGRAPLGTAAIEAIVEGCSGYCNLEYDLQSGARGRRNAHVAGALVSLTGAEAATVVNNNAAATMIILQTFAAGREVIVSRGELIEIGGSFRLPEIMRAGGAELHEVGTTNRTRLADYERAINDKTAVLMHVHTSNYRIAGFAESVPIDALAELAHRFNLIVVDDLGSGALLDFKLINLPGEPHVRRSVEAGADLACFSGDKLLGGPQCGVIVGRRELIQQIDSNPLMRTFRVDKLTLLALEGTLRSYVDRDEAASAVPALALMTASTDELARRARTLSEQLEADHPDEKFYVCSDVGYVGGGSMPGKELPTVVVQWHPARASLDEMMRRLRGADVPVIARARDGAVCFDLRTIRESDIESVVAAVSYAVWDREADDQ